MTNVRLEFHVIAGAKNPARSGEEDDPFRSVLIVLEAGRARLPGRDEFALPVVARLEAAKKVHLAALSRIPL